MKTKTILVLVCALGIWGCGSSKRQTVVQTPSAKPQTPPVQTKGDEVKSVIAQARQRYFIGERELNLGHLEKAKQEFDASLDLLMQYQSTHQRNPQIEAVINELQDKIHQHEMAALKAGDGFTESPLEPALFDELKNINTFPAPDQQTKKEVEQDLKTIAYDLPVEVNDKVLSFIRIFQNSRRKEFVGGLIRSGRYLDLMKKILREEGVPEDLVYTALIESSFKSNAYSRAKAKGFWQFIAGTAKRYDLRMDWWVDERSDFEKSTHAAAGYLRDLYGMFGDWYLALAGYNAGENTIINGLRRSGVKTFWQLAQTNHIRLETKNYVPAILAGMIIAKDPGKYGFWEAVEDPVQFDTVSIDYPVDLRLVAECVGASLEEIKLLNPELVRMTTPTKSSYSLRVPPQKKDIYLAEISAIPWDKRITWRKHEVRSGETLTTIAASYRTTPSSIAAANSFAGDSTLTVGQKVVIPIGRAPEVSYAAARTNYASGYGAKKLYKVKPGDTLFKVASKFRTTVSHLCAWNGFSSSHRLRIGELLTVHSGSPSVSTTSTKKIVHQVKRGDTLYQIANIYKTDVSSIKRWNNIKAEIYPGDRLTIYQK